MLEVALILYQGVWMQTRELNDAHIVYETNKCFVCRILMWVCL